jgi:hypothetical protein
VYHTFAVIFVVAFGNILVCTINLSGLGKLPIIVTRSMVCHVYGTALAGTILVGCDKELSFMNVERQICLITRVLLSFKSIIG